jgi:hypothetical protein
MTSGKKRFLLSGGSRGDPGKEKWLFLDFERFSYIINFADFISVAK